MAEQLPPENQETIEQLIRSFADQEPPFTSLGTPFLADTEATQALVQMGRPAILALVSAMDSPNPKIVAYAAYCLGQMGDPSVLPVLRQVQDNARKSPRGEYEFAVISVAGQAIETLSSRGHEKEPCDNHGTSH